MKSLLAAHFLLSVPAAAQLQSAVRKVPGDFPSIRAAILGANPGDVLLIAPGTYVLGAVIDKPLSLIADGGTVRIEFPLTITGIPAGAKVHLRGLEIEDQSGLGLEILACAGHVWVESCSVTSWSDPFSSDDRMGILVQGCDDVVLVDTRASGADQLDIDWPFGEGLRVLGSTVHAYHCVFEGGYASDSSVEAQRGMPGVSVRDDGGREAVVLLSGCTATGGDGWCNMDFCDGGNGPALSNTTGTVYVADSTFTAGATHGGTFGCQCSTVPATDGPYTTFAGSPVRVSADAPKREGQILTLTFEGPPAVPVWYATSVSSRGQLMPTLRGSSLLGPVLVSRFAGTLDATGRIDVPSTVPPIVAAGSGIRLFVQAFSGGPAILGGGSFVLILDDSL
jgi:hypothetical protein